MSRTAATVLAWVGAALFAVGLLVGFIPTSAGGASCGSAFIATDDAFGADLYGSMTGGSVDHQVLCSDRRSLLRVPAIGLILVGGGLGAAGWAVSSRLAHEARQTVPPSRPGQLGRS